MNQQLKRYEINYEFAYEYFQEQLSDVNALSCFLLKLINFKQGKFFTLLYGDINIKRINDLAVGGMAKKSLEPSRAFILDYIKKNHGLSLIFDDVTVDLKSELKDPFLVKYGSFYKEEFYYTISNEDTTPQTISEGFYASNALWHSLCVVSEVRIENTKKKLTQDQITSICQNAKLIVLHCYDGEAYVFWERFNESKQAL